MYYHCNSRRSLVEEKTRDQARSRLWFRMRSGRITASRFKCACCTNPASPSLSLIMAICHPETTKFKTTATCWGCGHESTACAKYKNLKSDVHQNFEFSSCGFFIYTEYPFLLANISDPPCLLNIYTTKLFFPFVNAGILTVAQ